MKICLLFATIIIVLSSCHHSDNVLKENITNADSVAINYFTGNGRMDTVTRVKIIREKNIIGQLTGFITASVSNIKPNCGLDGSIHYYRNDSVIMDIYFRMNEEQCRQFIFKENGKTEATVLSLQAYNLLEELNKTVKK